MRLSICPSPSDRLPPHGRWSPKLAPACVLLLLASGCGIPAVGQRCANRDDCAGGMDCAQGYCIALSGATSDGGAPDGGAETGQVNLAGLGCATCGETTCVDLQRDARHCGECDLACAGGQCCEAACTDTTSDPQHCGGCGTTCLGGTICRLGSCICADDEGLCFGNCRSLMHDFYNCGGCGNVCSATQTCVQGICTWPPEICSNAIDDDHSGACDDNCGSHAIHVEVRHGFDHYGNHTNVHYWVHDYGDTDGFSSVMWEDLGLAFRTATRSATANGKPALQELVQCRDANGRIFLSLADCGGALELASLGYVKGDTDEVCSEWVPLRALYEDLSVGRARYYTVNDDTAERYIHGGMRPLDTDRQWQVLRPRP